MSARRYCGCLVFVISLVFIPAFSSSLATGATAALGESLSGRISIPERNTSELRNRRLKEAANLLAPEPQRVFFATLYNWNATSGGVWTNAANWTPTRTTPATDDILQFPSGTYTVTGVPTETIGQLFASGGNSNVTLQPAAGNVVLTIAGGIGNDLTLQPSNSLNISGGTTNTNTLKIFLGAGASAAIGGSMTFSGAQHQIDAADVSGLVFNSGATFTYNPGATAGNPFTSAGTANAVAFNTGATYVFQSGANPFGLGAPSSKVVFNPGSLFKQTGTGTPAFSGRTYANYELANAASINVTGGTAMSIDNITVTQGTLNYNMTGTTGHTINGTISVASGATMNFAPATAATISVKGNIAIAGTLGFNPTVSETINLNGSSTQTISGAGNFAANATTTINDANAAGVTLSRNLDNLAGTFAVVSGGLLTTGTRIVQGTGTFSIASGGSMTIGDPNGVTAAPTASGNIQTGTRTFSPGARYTFNAASAQVTGDGINNPASLLNFNNPSGVTVSQSLSTDANGTIALTSGIVTTSSTASLLSNNSAGAIPPIRRDAGPDCLRQRADGRAI